MNVPSPRITPPYHPRPPKTKPRPSPRKLTPEEEQHVLAGTQFAEVHGHVAARRFATLLDEGIYLCSVSTMAPTFCVPTKIRERRNQRIHPPYTKPRLVAARRTRCGRGTSLKLAGPRPGVYYSLYVILDLYSRYVFGWMAAEAESGGLARKLLYETFVKHEFSRSSSLCTPTGAPR